MEGSQFAISTELQLNLSNLVRQYASAWAKTTEHEIETALASCWTPSSTYTDPITETTRGPSELAAAVLRFQALFPGASLAPTSTLDTHHGFGRFAWLLKTNAEVELNGVCYSTETEGFDYVEFSPDGTKILKVVGFFGPFPR